DLAPLIRRRVDADLFDTGGVQCVDFAGDGRDIAQLRRTGRGSVDGLPAVHGLDIEPPVDVRGAVPRIHTIHPVQALDGIDGGGVRLPRGVPAVVVGAPERIRIRRCAQLRT